MKIRIDYVTNSSSSSHIVINIHLKNGTTRSISNSVDNQELFFCNGDYDDLFDSLEKNSTLADLINKIYDLESHLYSLDEPAFDSFFKYDKNEGNIKLSDISSISIEEESSFEEYITEIHVTIDTVKETIKMKSKDKVLGPYGMEDIDDYDEDFDEDEDYDEDFDDDEDYDDEDYDETLDDDEDIEYKSKCKTNNQSSIYSFTDDEFDD